MAPIKKKIQLAIRLPRESAALWFMRQTTFYCRSVWCTFVFYIPEGGHVVGRNM